MCRRGFGVILSPVAGRHLRGSLSGFWLGGDKPINTYEDVPERIYEAQQHKAVQDMLGYCSYVYGATFDDWIQMAATATGRPFSQEDLLLTGLKAHNLEKTFNTIHAGFDRKDDYPCDRYFNESVQSGPYRGEHIDHEAWDAMLDEHYRLHGWDTTSGLQTQSSLHKLGLSDIAEKLKVAGKLVEA